MPVIKQASYRCVFQVTTSFPLQQSLLCSQFSHQTLHRPCGLPLLLCGPSCDPIICPASIPVPLEKNDLLGATQQPTPCHFSQTLQECSSLGTSAPTPTVAPRCRWFTWWYGQEGRIGIVCLRKLPKANQEFSSLKTLSPQSKLNHLFHSGHQSLSGT